VWEKQRSGHKTWLKGWVSGISSEIIAHKENLCSKTIQREINQFLANPPELEIKPNQNAHLLIDGTYFKRTNCLVIYFDNDLKHFQLMRYTTREIKDEIIKDLRALKRSGVDVASATADGQNAVKSALSKVFPKAEFQRCLVHIQRYAETYITQKPKTLAGLELREIVGTLNRIDSHMARMTFISRLNDWRRRHNDFLKERTTKEDGSGWWYTHRNLRRVVYHIEHAMPDMFRYLNDQEIPKDTNALEGRFTDLKQKLRTHRGLRKTKRENYFKWYIHYKNLKKKG
jgi:hypothetical protein